MDNPWTYLIMSIILLFVSGGITIGTIIFNRFKN
jgi:hypothetical protein